MLLITGLPGIGRRVEFDGEEVGRMVRKQMAEVVATIKRKWRSEKEWRISILHNYICVMSDLCEENGDEDSFKLWMQLFV